MYLATGLKYFEGKIHVAEMGPTTNSHVSIISQNAAGEWVREKKILLLWPTGLDVLNDPIANHTTLFVVESLKSKLFKYDLDANYKRTLVTEFE